MRFAASDSFELITESSSQFGFGVGGTVSRLWRGVFADVSFWQHKPEGERFFVDGGSNYPLGIPVRITFQPIDLVGGWRFELGGVNPYAGGGVTFMSYKEESDFATGSDDVDERKTGGLLLVGADIPLGEFIRLGGEFRYRTVTGVLGEGGVSAVFEEDQLGGSSYAFRVSVGR
jgi:Outer membrane protein beta-barrel domain